MKGSPEDFRARHPETAELVIEICVSSHEYDRSKLRAYAMAGVKEVWLVLGPEKQVEVYAEPKNLSYGKRSVCESGGKIRSETNSGVNLDLSVLFE